MTLMQGQCEMDEFPLAKHFHDNGCDKHATLMQSVRASLGQSCKTSRLLCDDIAVVERFTDHFDIGACKSNCKQAANMKIP